MKIDNVHPSITNKEWENEPDFEEFKYKGFVGIIKRTVATGTLCGYICMPKNGIYHKFLTRDIWTEDDQTTFLYTLNVYGGVTYQGYIKPENPGLLWCFGFDCCHYGDLMPVLHTMFNLNDIEYMTYRNFEFVKYEIKKIIDEILYLYSKDCGIKNDT